MPFRETTLSEKWKRSQPQGYGFFYLTPSSTMDTRRLELQEGIEKQEKYIAELEEYNLHAKEPIERDITTHEIYEKKVIAALTKIEAEIAEAEAKISYKLCPMAALPATTSKLESPTIYINSTTGKCKFVKPNQNNADSFYSKNNDLDLSHLNSPGLKSEILSLMLQKGIINDPILQQQILDLKKQCTKYKAYQGRLQETEDRIIDLNHKLNDVCKKINDCERSLPQEIALLKQLQAELVKIVIEPIIQETGHHLTPLPPGA